VLGAYVAPGPNIYVVYPPQRQASPRLRALLTFLRSAFAARGGRPEAPRAAGRRP
jgi:DNA-binding transcriptional LysR family regulator